MKAEKPKDWIFEALKVEALEHEKRRALGWEQVAIGAVVLAAFANAARILFV